MAEVNSGFTLDIRPTPGQDARFPFNSNDSILTSGNFRLERSGEVGNVDNLQDTLNFGPYSTINNSNSDDFDVLKIITTKSNELNLNPEDASSYAYFGSFYTKVANAINNVVDNFPYPLLAKSINSGATIFDYSHDLVQNTSSFKIALSSVTNQGNVIYVSGRTEQSEAQVDLYNETNLFAIQLSGESQSTTTGDTFMNKIHDITYYNYSANTYLEFQIKGILLPEEPISATTFTYPIYVRPSRQRYGEYKRTLPNLEDQLINDGTFLVPDSDTDTFQRETFVWPRNIDGFAPDSYGNEFEEYAESILSAARIIDEEKTNIMVRAILPENFLDLDSQNRTYRKLTTVYGEQFDAIKQYIDGIAYAHSVNYDGSESVPNKFLSRLANLLGAKLPNAFAAEDVLDYLSGEFDYTENSFEEYNLELWRRIMVNLIWLYKKRGTRDAISFIFRLLGAPECLFNLEEFVYDVRKVSITTNLFDLGDFGLDEEDGLPFGSSGFLGVDANDLTFENVVGENGLNVNEVNPEIDDGYPNVNLDIFQIGGEGRGNGQEFIDGLGAQYEPTKRIDNLKIETGNTRSVVNSKEINVDLRPSRAIECDVMDWYELGYGWWKWGSVSPIFFSGLTVPFEWQVEDIDTVVPDNITGMTIYQWLDYIYTNNVDPRDRKTRGWQQGTTGIYRDLKKIYITYMLWTNNQDSNRLTFRKLEKFLNLLERNYQELVPFFIPSTTIFNTYGTVYTNHEFNRHRFIYRPGINDGSEFQVEIPPVFEPTINVVEFTASLSNNFDPPINAANFTANIPEKPVGNVDISDFQVTLSVNPNTSTNLANTNTNTYQDVTNEDPVPPANNLTPIVYPN
jgi:hypothetical protein